MNEFGTLAKEIAAFLELNVNTLRKWSIALEERGYEIERNNKNQRIYYDRDVRVLSELKRLMERSTPFEKAVEGAIQKGKEFGDSRKTMDLINGKMMFTKEEVEDLVKKTAEETAAKTMELAEERIEREREATFAAFEHRMQNREESRDYELMQKIDQIQEQKRLEIASAEEEAQKKGLINSIKKVFKKSNV